MRDAAPRRVASRKRLRILAGIVLCGIVVFVGLLFTIAGPFRAVTGRGVNAAEANSLLWNCHVPDEAENVWFLSGYRGTRVECELPRNAFDAWCESHGWIPTAIAEHTPACRHSMRNDGPVDIRRGLKFEHMTGDVGYHGAYDIDTKTAYVSFSGG